MPIAGSPSTPKGELNLGSRRTRIDIEDAGRNIAHGPLYTVNILRIDSARQPVFRVIVYRNGFIKRPYFDHREYWPKYLFLCYTHIWAHIGEKRGSIEISTR